MQLQHPIYDVVQPILAKCAEFPSISVLNQLKSQTVSKQYLGDYRFVDQSNFDETSSFGYEQTIYETGQIMTREFHWHDFFNAMIWMTFPQTKISLNQAQYRDFKYSNTKQRSRKQNLLAHFDEDGVIMIYHSAAVAQAICQHDWQTLFYNQRECYGKHWQVWGFGHGLLEKCLKPYIGLTAKALLVKVEPSFFNLQKDLQRVYIDTFLTNAITHRIEFMQNYRLQPIPILGIFGWYTGQKPDFYQNTDYFRVKNHQSKPVIRLI